MGAAIGMLGVLSFLVAGVCVIRPVPAIGIRTRKQAVVLLVASIAFLTVGGVLVVSSNQADLATSQAEGPALKQPPPAGLAAKSEPPPANAADTEPVIAQPQPPAAKAKLEPPPSTQPTPMEQAVAKIPLKPAWDQIEGRDQGPHSYTFTLVYKPISEQQPMMSYGVAEGDTMQVARAVLAELVREGRKPSLESISISVWARQPAGQGETGVPVTKLFGYTTYNSRRDALQWSRQTDAPRHGH